MKRVTLIIITLVAASNCKGEAEVGNTTPVDAAIENPARPRGDGSPCSPFDLKFAPTCDGCPDAALACPCLIPGLGYDPIASLARCGDNGHCLRDLDCGELCDKAPAAPSQLADAGAFFSALTTLQICVEQEQKTCGGDNDCRVGRCVGEGTAAGGRCEQTGAGSVCFMQSDCVEGVCLYPADAGTPDASREPGSGLCSSGGTGNPCLVDGDCQPPYHCFINGTPFGTCVAGVVGDPCHTPADCQLPHCSVAGKCVAGRLGDSCAGNQDCASNSCIRNPFDTIYPANVCQSGAIGTFCFDNTQCQSGICALTSVNGRTAPGFCHIGEGGDPCTTGRDCRSLQCIAGGSSDTTSCQTTGSTVEGPCGDGGVCSVGDASLCLYGKCAPEVDADRPATDAGRD
jgi:hypothetical protein